VSALAGATRMATCRVVSDSAELIEVSREELSRVLASETSLRNNLIRLYRRLKERVGDST